MNITIQRQDLWLHEHLIVEAMKLAYVPMILWFHDHWKPILQWDFPPGCHICTSNFIQT
jgi:hypothetical protein